MDFYTYYRSTSSHRVRIAMVLKGPDYCAVAVNLFRDGAKHYGSEYATIKPQCLVPNSRRTIGRLRPRTPMRHLTSRSSLVV